jgi:hypothetical protein
MKINIKGGNALAKTIDLSFSTGSWYLSSSQDLNVVRLEEDGKLLSINLHRPNSI